MNPTPNRLGLGLRQPLQSYGQGPTMQALAQQQQMQYMQPPKTATLFVGSISGGITDAFLNQLLGVSLGSHVWSLFKPLRIVGMWSS